MNEKEAQENLEVIRKMIEETKKGVTGSGHMYIFWGVITLLAVLVTYVLAFFEFYQYILINWLVLMSLGFAYSIYRGITRERKAKVTTFSDRAMGYTWFGCGITLMILGFIAPLAGVYSGHMIPAVIAVVIGSACFITGRLYEWKLLTWASLLWWGGGVAMMVLKSESRFLIFPFLIIVGYLIPGFILRANYKKQSTE
jgi:lysylphosphatidylglycerol synthetase-like protein (DUF2156 family)